MGRGAVSSRIDRLAPFVEGIVVMAWATATGWIPLMIAIGVWRHIVRRVPLRYTPAFWAMVFPLGMYGGATYAMRKPPTSSHWAGCQASLSPSRRLPGR